MYGRDWDCSAPRPTDITVVLSTPLAARAREHLPRGSICGALRKACQPLRSPLGARRSLVRRLTLEVSAKRADQTLALHKEDRAPLHP